MVEITNTSQGLRGVNTSDQGTVWLQPGQTLDLQVSGEEMKALERAAKPPNASGLFLGSRQQAVEAERMAEGDGDLVDPASYDDVTTTDVAMQSRPIHPAPMGADLSQGDVPADGAVITADWVATEDEKPPEGEGGQTGDAGTNSPAATDSAAARKAKARE